MAILRLAVRSIRITLISEVKVQGKKKARHDAAQEKK